MNEYLLYFKNLILEQIITKEYLLINIGLVLIRYWIIFHEEKIVRKDGTMAFDHVCDRKSKYCSLIRILQNQEELNMVKL